jgi:tripartite-type tricarboxylate transporter receptor subunit TctC
VTGIRRHPLLPDVPTFRELGYEQFDGVQWYGVVGPANLPAPIVKRLSGEIAVLLQNAELREQLAREALEPMQMTPDQFSRFMRNDIARWTKLVKERNIEITE